MDPSIKQSELLKESFQTTTKTLRLLVDGLSQQKSISETDFVEWSRFMHDIKIYLAQMEFYCRVTPVTDNMDEFLLALRENTAALLKGLKK